MTPSRLLDRNLAKLRRLDTGCWLYERNLRRGYGRIRRSGGGRMSAHVYFHEALRPDQPVGTTLLCSNTTCVNPEHWGLPMSGPKELGPEGRVATRPAADNGHLHLVPITALEAKEFIRRHHRHHPPSLAQTFALAAIHGNKIVGVATVGRPVSRHLDDGWTLEVNRTCTDGTRNANSFLYGAAWRAARALGYRRLITYTLQSESGVSLRAAGWTLLGERGGGTWNRRARPRVDLHPLQAKFLWEAK